MAMNSRAQAAELRAACTVGVVKKRTITCGRPAVPNISAMVMKNTSMVDLLPSV
ncbi:hypothetical protein D3C80_2171730 [compost metagenome]